MGFLKNENSCCVGRSKASLFPNVFGFWGKLGHDQRQLAIIVTVSRIPATYVCMYDFLIRVLYKFQEYGTIWYKGHHTWGNTPADGFLHLGETSFSRIP